MLFNLCVLGLILTAVFAYIKERYYNYWQRRGLPYDTTSSVPFGCLGPVVANKKSMGAVIYDIYCQNENVPYVGINLLYRPALLVRDLELSRMVLAQDFMSFHDRGVYVDEKNDPLSTNLFSQQSKNWRSMRSKLTPCFSSGKLKNMFSVSEEVSDRMIEHLRKLTPMDKRGVDVDLEDIVTDYSTDIIASVIFGLEVNSFKQPSNAFRSIVVDARRNKHVVTVLTMLVFLCAPVMKLLIRMGFGQDEMALKLRDIMSDTIAYREKNNVVRKDMLQLLMQLRHSGEIKEQHGNDEHDWNVEKTKAGSESISMDQIAAQGSIFYIAGQETTAMTTGLTIFELSQYPKLFKRAQEEVDQVLAAHDGKITYENLKEMEFLELCIMETSRKYPGLSFLNRECMADYQIPDSKNVIKKGTPVIVSLQGLQWDPKYFPEPEVYNPDRFLPENAHLCNKNAYMPFGEGPRHCIAQRMGRVNVKLAVAKILSAFDLEQIPLKQVLEMQPYTVGMIPKGGINVKLTQRKYKQ